MVSIVQFGLGDRGPRNGDALQAGRLHGAASDGVIVGAGVTGY